LSAHRHRQFAARQDHRALALGARIARQRGVGLRHLSRLTLDAVAERDAFVARSHHRRRRGAQRVRRPRRQHEPAAGEHRIARFR